VKANDTFYQQFTAAASDDIPTQSSSSHLPPSLLQEDG